MCIAPFVEESKNSFEWRTSISYITTSVLNHKLCDRPNKTRIVSNQFPTKFLAHLMMSTSEVLGRLKYPGILLSSTRTGLTHFGPLIVYLRREYYSPVKLMRLKLYDVCITNQNSVIQGRRSQESLSYQASSTWTATCPSSARWGT